MVQTDERVILAGALRSYLEDLLETGIDELPLAITPQQPVVRPESSAAPNQPCAGVSASPAATAQIEPRRAPVADDRETLADIRADLGECQRCQLCASRKNIVFGSGSRNAKILFVGEAPGRDEDLQGEPFVGEAGQLLTNMIKAMGYERSEVYICNVLKCRPPDNRNPLPEEIAQCSPFLLRQVKAIAPKAIVALGTFAAQTLLGSKEPISRLRGSFHDYHGIPLMPTFHPAYLLRSPEKKREVWADLQQVMKLLVK
jgi:uracil-DNA glycosylase family 4